MTKKPHPRLYLVYKWFQFFFQALAEMFASCAEVGMIATLKAEYMQDAQSDSAQSDGCIVGHAPAEAGSSSSESPLVVQSAKFEN